MLKESKKIAAAVILISMFTCIGACGATNKGLNDFSAMRKEFYHTVDKLSWPQNQRPAANYLDSEEKSGTLYQPGWGDTLASYRYLCAWEREWLNTYASDAQRAQRALQLLRKVPDMGFMKEPRADRSVVDGFRSDFKKASLGDPSGFESDVKANCQ